MLNLELTLAGKEVESAEMLPQWFSIDQMPSFDEMMIDSKYWHNTWLAGKQFKAYFLIDEQVLHVLRHTIEEMPEYR